MPTMRRPAEETVEANAERKRPHIIWFVCDQLRYDALGFMGNPRVRTPHLDRLAGEGVVFDRMFVQYPTCMASRASLLTGRYPAATRMANGSPFLDPRETTLAETLQRAGYRTGMFGKLHLTPQLYTSNELHSDRPVADWRRFVADARLFPIADDPAKRDYGFQEVVGFEDALWGEYVDWLDGRDRQTARRLRAHGRSSETVFHREFPGTFLGDVATRPVAAELHPSMFIAESAVEFFSRHHAQRPCFLHVSFVDPHHPFDPPKEIAETYDIPSMPLPKYGDTGDIRWPPTIRDRLERAAAPPESVTAEMIRTTTAYYYATIETIDRAVGRVIAAVEAAGEMGNTLFLFISDHGEYLGSYGLWRKASMHYECMIRVPCFLAWRGAVGGGRRFDGLAQQIDVVPTLLELLGMSRTPGVQGESFADVLRGERQTGRDWTYTQSHWAPNGGPYANCLTVRTDTAKLNYYPDDDAGHLFDLAEDPDERRDVFAAADRRDLRDAMLRLLVRAAYAQQDPLPRVLSQW